MARDEEGNAILERLRDRLPTQIVERRGNRWVFDNPTDEAPADSLDKYLDDIATADWADHVDRLTA
jgi:hypothetical protein